MTEQPTLLGEGEYLRLMRLGTQEFVERQKASGVAVILALTDDLEILLLEQYRPAIRSALIELPGGLVGDEQGHERESLEAGARRELAEETGYSAKDMLWLGDGPSSAGLCSEIVTFYMASGLSYDETLREDKNGPLHKVKLPDVTSWLEDRRRGGVAIDFRIHAALCLAAGRQLISL